MINTVLINKFCIGCATCERICPSVFRVNPNTGKAEVTTSAFDDLESPIHTAVEACPVSNIEVTRSDNTSNNGELSAYRTASVHGLKYLTDNVIELLLYRKDFSFIPGQFITLRIRDDDGPFLRPYSISGYHNGEIRLCIKLHQDGRAARVLSNLKLSDTIEISKAKGDFQLKPGNHDKLFIATGTGIAPIIPMLKKVNGTPKKVLFGVRSEKDLYYVDEIENFPNTSLQIALSRPTEKNTDSQEYVTDLLAKENLSPNTDVYICGSEAMSKSVVSLLEDRGHPPEKVVSESYLPAASVDPRPQTIQSPASATSIPSNLRFMVRNIHYYTSLSMAMVLLFYGITGFIANRSRLFLQENKTVDASQNQLLPPGVQTNIESVKAYLTGSVPGIIDIIAMVERRSKILATLPTEKAIVRVVVDKKSRSVQSEYYYRFPKDVTMDRKNILPWLTQRYSGHIDEQSVEEEDNFIYLDAESIWGIHSFVVNTLEHVYQVDSRKAPFAQALIDIHRGKHIGKLQRVVVDSAALVLVMLSFSGCLLAFMTKNRKQKITVSILISISLAVLCLLIVNR